MLVLGKKLFISLLDNVCNYCHLNLATEGGEGSSNQKVMVLPSFMGSYLSLPLLPSAA